MDRNDETGQIRSGGRCGFISGEGVNSKPMRGHAGHHSHTTAKAKRAGAGDGGATGALFVMPPRVPGGDAAPAIGKAGWGRLAHLGVRLGAGALTLYCSKPRRWRLQMGMPSDIAKHLPIAVDRNRAKPEAVF